MKIYARLINLALISYIVLQIALPACASGTIINDNCYLSRIKDKTIGSVCITQKKDENFIITNKHIENNLSRLGYDLKSVKDYEYIEDSEGNPLKLNVNIKSQGEEYTINAVFKDKKIIIDKTAENNTVHKEIAYDDKIFFPYAIQRIISNNMNNDSFTFTTVDPVNDFRLIKVTYSKIQKEILPAYNTTEPLTQFRISIDLLPNFGNLEWYNSKGSLVKKYSSVSNLEETLVSRKQVEASDNKNNFSLRNIIPVDVFLKDPDSIQQITYKISAANSALSSFISDDRQRLIQSFNDSAYIKVILEKSSKDKYKYPIDVSGYSKTLESGIFINTQSDKIKQIAGDISSKSTDAYDISKEMTNWVNKNIAKKDLSDTVSNAETILRNAKGNCIEQSILLASMLRTSKIPAKIVGGLIYSNAPENSFVYHVWVKAYIGKWINLDPYYISDVFSPVHIALSESDFNKIEDKNIVLSNLFKDISGYKIAVLNYNLVDKPVTNIKVSENAATANNLSMVSLLKQDNNSITSINTSSEYATAENMSNINSLILDKYTHDELIRQGFYNFSNGNIQESLEAFKQASDVFTQTSPFSDIQFAKRLSSLGLFELAEKNLENVYDKDIWGKQMNSIKLIYFPQMIPTGDTQIKFAKALSLINYQNNPDLAIQALKNDKSSESNMSVISDYSNFLLAKAYFLKKDYVKAETYINKAISLNSNNLSYKMEKAKILNSNHKSKEAIKLLGSIMQVKIYDKSLNSLLLSQKYKYLSELQVKKELKDYYLAKYNYEIGEYKKAEELLLALLKNNISSSIFNKLLGEAYLAEGILDNSDKARDCFNRAMKSNNKDSELYMSLGDIEFANNNYQKALEQYLKSQSKGNISAGITIKIGLAYEMLDNDKKSSDQYFKAAREYPNDYEANYYYGEYLASIENNDAAQKYLKTSISLNPMNIAPWIELSKIELKNKNTFLALDYLTPVKYINPESADYYYILGLISSFNDNLAEASKYFNKALAINPNHSPSRIELEKIEDKN